MFDLHDIRAHASKKLGAKGHRLHLFDREDTNTFERKRLAMGHGGLRLWLDESGQEA
jgi:hypothetical protein